MSRSEGDDDFDDRSSEQLDFDDELTRTLITLMKGRSLTKLIDFFSKDADYLVSRVNLMQVYEKETGFSLLHLAVFKKFSGDIEKVLLNQIKENCKDPEKIKKYLSAQTRNDDGHTALHLASFHGNFSAIKFLIQEGADPQVASKNSLSYLHIAAQGDQPYAFYIRDKFNLKSIDVENDLTLINCRDKNGCTPLHWAVYMGSPISISYLLANKDVDIDARDIWG